MSVHAIDSVTLQDVPMMLRRLADAIDAGAHGDVDAAVVVIRGDDIEVFGYGRADADGAHRLLGSGQRRLEQ